jgi:hypothetical protein
MSSLTTGEFTSVDACIGEVEGEIAISKTRLSSSLRPAGHVSAPRSLRALAEGLYGHSPEAWLIGVPAVESTSRSPIRVRRWRRTASEPPVCGSAG